MVISNKTYEKSKSGKRRREVNELAEHNTVRRSLIFPRLTLTQPKTDFGKVEINALIMFISNLSNQEKKTLLLIFFFSVNIIHVNSVDTDLTVEIAPGSQECFYQQITKTGETTLEVEYQVRMYFIPKCKSVVGKSIASGCN